jgi:hypothetical protein
MTLPPAVQAIWDEMESVRGQVLAEAGALSQAQADWRPAPGEWSIGEILNHLAIAETNTGKLTTKLTREAEAAGAIRPYPTGLTRFASLPARNPHGTQAPEIVRPQANLPIDKLLDDLRGVRARSRQSLEKIGGLDPRPLTFKHFALGDLDLAQWWMLQATHDRVHLEQLRAVTAAPGFPRG